MLHLESKIQQGIVRVLRKNGIYVFSIPNGLITSKASARIAVAEGLKSGVADLEILLPNNKILFVEVKTSKGKQSKEQKKFEKDITELGYEYQIWKSIEDCFKFIKTVKE